jgi:deoxyinosine 3'endonuclease (endonuclease V)
MESTVYLCIVYIQGESPYVTPGITCYITLSIRPLVIGVALTMLCRRMSPYRRSMIGFILFAQEAIIAESNLYKRHLKDVKKRDKKRENS